MKAILRAITAAAEAYCAWVTWKLDQHVDEIEDEIDSLANDGSAAAQLRIKRLLSRERKHAKCVKSLRSTTDTLD